MFNNKQGKGNILEIVLIIGMIVIIANYVKPGIFSVGGAEGPTGGTGGTGGTEYCADPSNTLTWGPLTKRFDPSTSITTAGSGGSIRYYLDGKGTGTTGGSTLTVMNGKKVTGIYAFGNTANTADTTYYTEKFDFTMPCGPTQSIQFSNGALVANGSITFNAFNKDTGNKNAGTGADNETIGTGETGEFTIELSTADKTGLSPIGGQFMLIVEVNKSDYDESKITLNGVSGVAVPSFYTLANTDSYAVGFEFPACPTGDSRRCLITGQRLSVQADSTINPPGTGSTTAATQIGNGYIKLAVIDQNYGTNTITDEVIGPAYANNDNTALGPLGLKPQIAYLSVD